MNNAQLMENSRFLIKFVIKFNIYISSCGDIRSLGLRKTSVQFNFKTKLMQEDLKKISILARLMYAAITQLISLDIRYSLYVIPNLKKNATKAM